MVNANWRCERCGRELTEELTAENQDLRHCQFIGMRDGQERRLAADGGQPMSGTPVKTQVRRATVADDLDIAPQHALRVTGPERFHGRLFRREAAREMNRGYAPMRAVRNLAGREDPLQKAVAIPCDRRLDAVDIGRIEPEPDDIWHSLCSKGKRSTTEMILPQPSSAFEWRQLDAGTALVCRPLGAIARHLFTTRSWPLGSSGSTAGDAASWSDIARSMDVGSDHLLRVHQVHGASVVVQRTGQARAEHAEADVILSDDPSVVPSIQTADCVPLLIADSRTGSVAAAHAGWRGVSLRVPAVTVRALAEAFGSRPSDLVVAIGPAIGSCCYEVGTDVRSQFEAAGFPAPDLSRWFHSEPDQSPTNPPLNGLRNRTGHWFLDFWTAARDQLIEAGVPAGQVFAAELCTASHPDAFCSYRRDGSRSGCLAAAIRKFKA